MLHELGQGELQKIKISFLQFLRTIFYFKGHLWYQYHYQHIFCNFVCFKVEKCKPKLKYCLRSLQENQKENCICSLSKNFNSLTFLKSILTLQFDANYISIIISVYDTKFWKNMIGQDFDNFCTVPTCCPMNWSHSSFIGALGLSVKGVNISIISVCLSASAK